MSTWEGLGMSYALPRVVRREPALVLPVDFLEERFLVSSCELSMSCLHEQEDEHTRAKVQED